ncbi:LysR family transcriptional regulator [Hydrogenophaga sp. BPS33]|uniref:LysR family transcriptional regulator n=1 Tax=Hydrogenophaga sp. BPS33 TaxID=2651974 RepID=UPI00132003FC|nr:LysR family transcriptional regulator [Hydrogenophaga sp. BPS33]QHE86883.1 LysR family transcriptional regulator [Hydrogenophaga sp. BPS33]
MKFRLRQMEVFRAVMLTGSINGASKLLFISQPAVSRIVAHTEQTLGLALFTRAKGKLVPTPEGEALFREVDGFYQQALRVDEFARNLAHGSTGTLMLCSSPCLSRGLMARAITRFVQRYPQIRVNYHVTLLADMAAEVLGHKVDLAVSVMPLQHPNLQTAALMEGRMVCVMPRGHELSQRPAVAVADLARYPLIAHDRGIAFGQLVTAAFRKAGVELVSRIDIQQTEVACSLVRTGAGLALVDEFTVDGMDWPDLQVLPLVEDIVLTPSVVRSVFDQRTTHADKFVEVLQQQVADDARRPLQTGT